MILKGLAIITTLALSLSQVLAADQQPALFEKKRSNVSFNKVMVMSLMRTIIEPRMNEILFYI